MKLLRGTNSNFLKTCKTHNTDVDFLCNNGAIYYNMRSFKSRFKYALRSVRSKEMTRADAVASDFRVR